MCLSRFWQSMQHHLIPHTATPDARALTTSSALSSLYSICDGCFLLNAPQASQRHLYFISLGRHMGGRTDSGNPAAPAAVRAGGRRTAPPGAGCALCARRPARACARPACTPLRRQRQVFFIFFYCNVCKIQGVGECKNLNPTEM